MAKLHSDLVQKSIKYLNSLPKSNFFPYSPGPYGRRAVSDIVGCYRSRFVAVEIKIGKDTLSSLQKRFIRKAQEADGFGRACWSIEEVRQFVKDINTKLEPTTAFRLST
ncbi:MAG TPA: hypothetical protein ENI23_03450 [bacterium]|nr:hypothetical protein [bacterium]